MGFRRHLAVGGPPPLSGKRDTFLQGPRFFSFVTARFLSKQPSSGSVPPTTMCRKIPTASESFRHSRATHDDSRRLTTTHDEMSKPCQTIVFSNISQNDSRRLRRPPPYQGLSTLGVERTRRLLGSFDTQWSGGLGGLLLKLLLR